MGSLRFEVSLDVFFRTPVPGLPLFGETITQKCYVLRLSLN